MDLDTVNRSLAAYLPLTIAQTGTDAYIVIQEGQVVKDGFSSLGAAYIWSTGYHDRLCDQRRLEAVQRRQAELAQLSAPKGSQAG